MAEEVKKAWEASRALLVAECDEDKNKLILAELFNLRAFAIEVLVAQTKIAAKTKKPNPFVR